MIRHVLCLGALAASFHFTLGVNAADPPMKFKKIQITDKFWSEGANFADFNHDGKMDVVSGPFWYEGPDFKVSHELYPATAAFKKKNTEGTEAAIPGFEGGLGVKNA